MFGVILAIISQLATVADESGLLVFKEVPIRSKGLFQYEMVLDHIIDTIPYSGEIEITRSAKGLNNTEWGFVDYEKIHYEMDSLGHIDSANYAVRRISGWILLKFKDTHFVESIEEEPGHNYHFDFGMFCWGQSVETLEEINTTRNFSWTILLFVGILIGELVVIHFIKIKKKWFLIIALWLLTTVGFGYGNLQDILAIIKGGLIGGS